MATKYRIPLTSTDGKIQPIDVRQYNRVSIQFNGATWSTAVVDLEWSLDGENFFAMNTAVQFSTSLDAKHDINVDAIDWIRLRTTTEASGASSNVEVYIGLYKVQV